MKLKLIVILAALLAIVAATDAMSKDIFLTSDPAGADVNLTLSSDKVLTCKTPCMLSFKPRRVKSLSVNLNGYAPIDQADPFDRDVEIDPRIYADALRSKKSRSMRPRVIFNFLTQAERDVRMAKIMAERSALIDCPIDAETQPDAQPLVRVTPIKPSNISENSFCDVTYNVAPTGRPADINAICTDPVLKNPTVRAVEKWVHNPRILNGESVSRCGVENKIVF